MLSGVREPHDKHLLDRLAETLAKSGGHGPRVQALTLLGHVARRQPTWLYKLANHGLFKELLKLLKVIELFALVLPRNLLDWMNKIEYFRFQGRGRYVVTDERTAFTRNASADATGGVGSSHSRNIRGFRPFSLLSSFSILQRRHFVKLQQYGPTLPLTLAG